MRSRYEVLWDNLKKNMNDKDLYEIISEYNLNKRRKTNERN